MGKLVVAVVLICMFCALSMGTAYSPYRYRYYQPHQRTYHRVSVPSTVAFTVRKTSPEEFTGNATVTFDQILTNIGKAFNAGTNQVVIPTTGLYYVSYFAPGNDTDSGNVDFIKNGQVLFSSSGTNGGNAATLFLKRGDVISLRGRDGSILLGGETTLSGFLIKSGFFQSHSYGGK